MNTLQILILVISLLVLITAAIWGAKRYRQSKYGRIKTRLRYKSSGEEGFEEDYGSELPGGGARVVGHRDPEDIQSVNSRIREQAEASKPKLSFSRTDLLEQASLDLGLEEPAEDDPHIPMLLDPADEVNESEQPLQNEEALDVSSVSADIEAAQELNLSEEQESEDTDLVESEVSESTFRAMETQIFQPNFAENFGAEKSNSQADSPEDELVEAEDFFNDGSEETQVAEDEAEETEEREEEKPDHSILFSAPETTEKQPSKYRSAEPQLDEEPQLNREPQPEPYVEQEPQLDKEPEEFTDQSIDPNVDQSIQQNVDEEFDQSPPEQAESDEPAEAEPQKPDEVIIVNLMSTEQGDEFLGTELCAALAAQGMVHGDMDIFHYDSGSGSETVRFSVANIINPGTFPKDKLEYFYTPGICFFMTLTPGVSNLQTFNQLLSTARGVASRLGGELRDQERQYLTYHRIEEIRTRMGEFQRENLPG